MLKRKANARWNGTLKEGDGKMNFGSYKDINYSFTSRFEDGEGTNPEEMIGAAHAGCFSMAFSAGLEKAGFKPNFVETNSNVIFEKVDGDFRITGIELDVNVDVPNVDDAKLEEIAQGAKQGCPISNALSDTIELSVDLNRA